MTETTTPAEQERPLDGVWTIERLSGALPPLSGFRKRIAGSTGVTVAPLGVQMPFEVRGLALHYKFPPGLVDHLERVDDHYEGSATVMGREVGRFRMDRIGAAAKEG
jgi:hypothetical protein